MAEQTSRGSTSASEVPERLHAVAKLLREKEPFGPDARRELAELVDELATALGSTAPRSPEAAHVADSAAHLIETLHREENPASVASARERFEAAILGTEARSPILAGIARRLMDALTGLGI